MDVWSSHLSGDTDSVVGYMNLEFERESRLEILDESHWNVGMYLKRWGWLSSPKETM